MTALAIPEPTALVQSPDALCSQVEAWADTVDNIDQLNDAKARLQAIDTYLAQTTTAGRQRVAATMRRLEIRIGSLMGPPPGHGPGRGNVPREEGLPTNRLSEFRAMAANEDIVEEVIASSTDDDPASRRKVMKAIRERATPIDSQAPRQRLRHKDPFIVIRSLIDQFTGQTIAIEQHLLVDSCSFKDADAEELAAWNSELKGFIGVLNKTKRKIEEARDVAS